MFRDEAERLLAKKRRQEAMLAAHTGPKYGSASANSGTPSAHDNPDRLREVRAEIETLERDLGEGRFPEPDGVEAKRAELDRLLADRENPTVPNMSARDHQLRVERREARIADLEAELGGVEAA
jgi:hypothetical protein